MIPNDQGRGSFEGSWAHLAVPVAFDRDFYVADNGEVMPAFRNALNTWNHWANIRGFSAFRIVDDGSGQTAGRDIPPINDVGCAQASYSASVTDVVGIWKIATAGDHANVRSSCTGGQRILAFDPATGAGVQGQTDWITQNGKVTGASILLNFEGFNAPGRAHVDTESLLLHELGHVLGLLHSCNGSTGNTNSDATTAPACTNVSLPDAYKNAVMFPYLQINQERRNLTQNDLSRVNCLY